MFAPVVFQFHAHQLIAVAECGFLAACLPVFVVEVAGDDLWLSPVGQSEMESPQFLRQPVVVFPKLGVLIVGPMLIDDISDQPIVSRRLDAEASAVSYAPYPDEQTL